VTYGEAFDLIAPVLLTRLDVIAPEA